MTLEDAINVLNIELALDASELEIVTSTLLSIHEEGYKCGWSAGYADALDDDDAYLDAHGGDL